MIDVNKILQDIQQKEKEKSFQIIYDFYKDLRKAGFKMREAIIFVIELSLSAQKQQED